MSYLHPTDVGFKALPEETNRRAFQVNGDGVPLFPAIDEMKTSASDAVKIISEYLTDLWGICLRISSLLSPDF